jgi:hypothetical protein
MSESIHFKVNHLVNPQNNFGCSYSDHQTTKNLTFLHFAYNLSVVKKPMQTVEEEYNSMFVCEDFDMQHLRA